MADNEARWESPTVEPHVGYRFRYLGAEYEIMQIQATQKSPALHKGDGSCEIIAERVWSADDGT